MEVNSFLDSEDGCADFFSFADSGWKPIEETDALALYEKVAPIDGHIPLGAHINARMRTLPMYDEAKIICLTSDTWENGVRVCFLENEGNLYRLNGTSPPIHKVNEVAPIRIVESNVLYYISFFCLFVHGEGGPFYVVHDLEDELLPTGFADCTPQGASSARTPRDLFRRPRLFGQNERGFLRASALILYANSLFAADFEVQPKGIIEMVEDVPLMEELDAQIGLVLSPTEAEANAG